VSYLTEWKTGQWRRKIVVGRKCDRCGKVKRGQAAAFWRVNVWPIAARSRRDRRRAARRLHLCSARCLLLKLGAMTGKVRVRVTGGGSPRPLLAGLVLK
jgi:hypothetical protein